MKTTCTLIALAALILFSPAVLGEDAPRPLDTRTRCIVLLRECHVLIEKKDLNGIFQIVADGDASGFKLCYDSNSNTPTMKQKTENADKFIEENFKYALTTKTMFDKILFSDVVTQKEPVSVKNTTTNEIEKGTLHSIRIKFPDSSRKPGELRFIEIAEKLYWVPFGW